MIYACGRECYDGTCVGQIHHSSLKRPNATERKTRSAIQSFISNHGSSDLSNIDNDSFTEQPASLTDHLFCLFDVLKRR